MSTSRSCPLLWREVAQTFDVIIAGVGGMGSAAAGHLASRGMRVLGLERFGIPNEMGSSHGVSRIIRLAYFEDPGYVPLLRRSFELWRELERRAGRTLLHMTGCLDVGAPGTRVFDGALRSSLEHGLAHEVLTADQVMDRFPAYQLPEGCGAILEPEGGFLLPELCIEAHAAWARDGGADLRSQERLTGWEQLGERVRVTTDHDTYDAGHLVISVGSWAGKLAPVLSPLLQPERQVLAWLQTAAPADFRSEVFPVFVMEVPEGIYYGFPLFADGPPGFKLGRFHHRHETVDPDEMDRRPSAADEEVLRAFARRYLPGGSGPSHLMKVCTFTNTPDEHFIIDRYPGASRVVVAAGFSGHGFKFCSVVGEIVADLVIEGRTAHPIDLFRIGRRQGPQPGTWADPGQVASE